MPKTFPQLISASYQRRFEGFQAAHSDPAWLAQRLTEFPEYPLFAEHLQLLWGASDFVGEQSETDPELFQQLVDSGDLQRSYSREDLLTAINQRLSDNEKALNEEQLAAQLRLFRRREQMRIIWRDFSRQASMPETTRELTWMAEAAITAALNVLYSITCEELGAPFSDDDQVTPEQNKKEQKMLVLAMGKMGAEELNLSSDIDLIFAYPEKGETRRTATSPRGKTVSNQEFFTRLGQKLIAALDRQTADGFVFRVDMRLRPYGQSGALVMSFDALEEYYLTQGREWERFAMVKARAVAGEPADIQRLDEILRPFTYRKYLDFGAIDALRDLKRSINRELKRKGMQTDIKLGPGGIREIEFITQAFQLVRGGRNSGLQTPSLYRALQQLATDQIIDVSDRDKLWQAYVFLRNTEHVLQGIADKQTQQLPEDELGQQRVALIVGYANWAEFQQQLQAHRDYVISVFEDMFADPDTQADGQKAGSDDLDYESLWRQTPELDELLEHLQDAGYKAPQAVAEQLYGIFQSKAVIALDLEPRRRLDKLMPNVVAACAATDNNSMTLSRVVSLIQAVLRRSAYLVLLAENPTALQQLLLLCQSSSWIAEQLTAYPVLLDELLDSESLFTAQSKDTLQDQLRQQMLRVADDDLEQQMEVIRYFVRSNSLRVAACDITEVIPLMQVSDYLTWIAEVVIDHTVTIAWQHLSQQYGQPEGSSVQSPGFIVLGYGKLGGIELGYKSDLDLVFLHRGTAGQTADGPRSIDNNTFYARLGQRIIHVLSTVTPSGAAYEIDMRLRPSGNSGMLVSSLKAFEKYQRESAWTWEQQALVRARVVAGEKALADEFNNLRQTVLMQSRDKQILRTEVEQMREKMRKHLGRPSKEGKYSLKQGAGGIVDIEFMVQFAVLAWSHNHPEISRWSDTIRIIESLAQCGLLSEQQSSLLIDAYKRYRSAGHRLQLQNQLAEVSSSEFLECRQLVTAQWAELFNQKYV
ncbi:Glutamate-ammonia-ligase adenylyltransferase [Gammaproteobacteria bacterium MOLA455]|nr:Glutamate-ammonia-ligase adenylyltransferase [Gammaproteobacteria bacterium MOLA455]